MTILRRKYSQTQCQILGFRRFSNLDLSRYKILKEQSWKNNLFDVLKWLQNMNRPCKLVESLQTPYIDEFHKWFTIYDKIKFLIMTKLNMKDKSSVKRKLGLWLIRDREDETFSIYQGKYHFRNLKRIKCSILRYNR